MYPKQILNGKDQTNLQVKPCRHTFDSNCFLRYKILEKHTCGIPSTNNASKPDVSCSGDSLLRTVYGNMHAWRFSVVSENSFVVSGVFHIYKRNTLRISLNRSTLTKNNSVFLCVCPLFNSFSFEFNLTLTCIYM